MEQTEKKKTSVLILIVLHISLLMSSLSGVCAKLAASNEPFSLMFFVWYGLDLLIMMGYAVAWQQILKRMPLTTAFANKPVALVWGMIWGAVIFKEVITWKMILGAAVIFVGIYLVVTSNE